MIALQIEDVPRFFSSLLVGNIFDEFTVAEAQATTFYTMTIDGRREKRFFEESDAEAETETAGGREYVRWQEVRPRILEMIRGKKMPLLLRAVLFFPKEELTSFLEEKSLSIPTEMISGLCLNIRYGRDVMTVTTGVSLSGFIPDHSIDRMWDEYVREFLRAAGIAYTE